MAERPVFIPKFSGFRLVDEVLVEFKWHPGMAASQKMKNVDELHHAAAMRGLGPLLEVSSKAASESGRKLSAFSLKIVLEGREIPLECAFQGSKVFEQGGPDTNLYWGDGRDAKRDPRLKESGRLLGFRFEGKDYPLTPPTAFYDWIYFRALYPYREWIAKVGERCSAFTDIEFNPSRSINCQARSLALAISLLKRNLADDAIKSFDDFLKILAPQTLN